jgi:hypothetical protein
MKYPYSVGQLARDLNAGFVDISAVVEEIQANPTMFNVEALFNVETQTISEDGRAYIAERISTARTFIVLFQGHSEMGVHGAQEIADRVALAYYSGEPSVEKVWYLCADRELHPAALVYEHEHTSQDAEGDAYSHHTLKIQDETGRLLAEAYYSIDLRA